MNLGAHRRGRHSSFTRRSKGPRDYLARHARAERLERRVLLSDPATIVWTNKGTAINGGTGDTDHFGAIFGTLAPTARADVQAAIDDYQRMIGSFNYSTPRRVYDLDLSMLNQSGFSATAQVNDDDNGKPDNGTVYVNSGQNTGDPNDDNGWFLDPTPEDSSEFEGNIVDAFAGDAQGGSPAAGKADFYTIIASELTHCMGQYGDQLSDWANLTTNTNMNDQVLTGKLWVFRGPDVKHLLTSDNAGTQDSGAAYHTAEPQTITYAGDTYVGTQDTGNATFENGRRYLLDNIHALMFADAFGYSTVNPATFGSFYSVLNQSTHELDIRGGDFTSGSSPSNDFIDISVSGSTLTVSVDIGNDIPGSGALPGAGNLPAFVSQYNVSQVTSIIVQAGAGDDTIVVDSLPANMPTTISGGEGNDYIAVGGGDYAANILSNIHVSAEVGNDILVVNDLTHSGGNNSYNVGGFAFSKPGTHILGFDGNLESEYVYCSPNDDQINIGGTSQFVSTTIDGGNGNDQFYWGNGDTTLLQGAVSINGNNGNDTLNVVDDSSSGDDGYVLTNTTLSATAAALLSWNNTMESLILAASPGNNQFILNTRPGNLPITINGNSGNDSIYIDPVNYNTSATNGAISINGGAGTDNIYFNDSLSTGYTVALSGTSVTRTNSPVYNYSQMEGLGWNAVGGSNQFIVGSTSAGTPVTVNGGSGNDLYTNGSPVATLDLSNYQAPVTIDGGGGINTILFGDGSTTTAHTYAISANSIIRDGSAGFSYSNIGGVQFTCGALSDTINITGTTLGTNLQVDTSAGDDTVNVVATASGSGAGSFVLLYGLSPALGGQGDTLNVNSDGTGTATAEIFISQSPAVLNILNGGTMLMNGPGVVITAKTLNISPTGVLTIAGGDAAMVNYTGIGNSPIGSWNGSAYTGVSGYIASGRNGGSWNGKGIDTSAASGNLYAIGVGEASQVLNISGTQTKLFYGQPADATTVLVKYTYGGDATLDGKINVDDYIKIDNGIAAHLTGWTNGDFNYDGKINIDDYTIIDNNIGIQGSPFSNAAGAGLVGLKGTLAPASAWLTPPPLAWDRPFTTNDDDSTASRLL